MSDREKLIQVLDRLRADRLRELVSFAEFLSWQDEQREWQDFGKAQLARAYGDHEPEYTVNDCKSERVP
jgi:hypothetical protein